MSKKIFLSPEESKWLVAALQCMAKEPMPLTYRLITIARHEVDRLIAKVSQEPVVAPPPPEKGAQG